MDHVPQRSRSSHLGADNYADFRSVSTPTRWHPNYATRERGMTPLPNSGYGPPYDSSAVITSGLLSPIPEDTSALHYGHSNLGLDMEEQSDERQVITDFSDVDIDGKRFVSGGYSKTSRPRHSRPENGLWPISAAGNDLTRIPRAGKFLQREKKDAKNLKTRRSFRSNADSVRHLHLKDDSPSQSSEGYGSSPNFPDSERKEATARPNYSRPRGEESQDSTTTDSDSLEWRDLSGRSVDRRKRHFRSSKRLYLPETPVNRTFPEAELQSKEDVGTELQSFPTISDKRLYAKASSRSNNLSEGQRSRLKSQAGMRRSQRQLSSSLNSLQVPSSSDRSALGSPRSSRRSEATLNFSRSEAARGSRASRQQSVFRLKGSAVSAHLVSSEPSAAADAAFASMELPPGLLPTSSKQLRQMCRSMITCLLLLMLAGSLSAAVYFAVVLNKTQAETIEHLRARLNFYLNQTSSDSLTSMSASERTRFEEEYCQEINDYYQKSELSDSYRGCEIASVQPGKLSVLLYFDTPAGQETSGSYNATGDAILKVLASSAPRIPQQEDDVISVNNILLQLNKVDINIEQTTQTPRFSAVDWQNMQQSVDSTETITAEEQDTTKMQNSTSFSPKDHFHPCAIGESETYYRYPGSCAMFFQCLDGRSIALTCGHHLAFDLSRKVCVREVADCDEDSEENQFFSDAKPEDLLPCEHQGGSFHPHPHICNLYFQCSTDGESVIGICPHRLVFNPHLNTCHPLKPNSTCPEARGSSPNTEGSQTASDENESVRRWRKLDGARTPKTLTDNTTRRSNTTKTADSTDTHNSHHAPSTDAVGDTDLTEMADSPDTEITSSVESVSSTNVTEHAGSEHAESETGEMNQANGVGAIEQTDIVDAESTKAVQNVDSAARTNSINQTESAEQNDFVNTD